MTKRIVTQGLQKLNRKISRSLSLLFEQRRKPKSSKASRRAKKKQVERSPKMMVKGGSTVISKIIKLKCGRDGCQMGSREIIKGIGINRRS